MKLLSVLTETGPQLAAKVSSGIIIFSQIRHSSTKYLPTTLEQAFVERGGLSSVLPRLREAAATLEAASVLCSDDAVRMIRPYKPSNVIAVGLNYREHAKESNLSVPVEPVLFAKWTSSTIGPGEPIILPPSTEEVDYEAELAVIIGKRCHKVDASEALGYIAGYTCMNDVTARDFQRRDGQWTRAKSLDTFGPLGPWIVTADEISDPQDLRIRCRVNGQTVQDSSTSDMIFSVREIIAHISRGTTLHPGDLITTGTPHGVGYARKPPLFLKHGDEVAIEIDRIGTLVNRVI